jgi:hypothetical protein
MGCGAENEELGVLHGAKPEKRDEKGNKFRYRLHSWNARSILAGGERRVVDTVWLAWVPAIREPGEVLVHEPKDHGYDRELNEELIKKNLREIAYRLTARKQGCKYYEDNHAGEAEVKFQHPDVKGKQSGADNLSAEGDITLLLTVAAGHKKWMAMLLEDGLDFGFGKRSLQPAFLVLDLRVNVLGEFFDDVVGLRCGKAGFNGFQIAIDNLHDGSLYAADAQDGDAYFTELQRNPRQQSVPFRNRAQRRGADGQQQHCGKYCGLEFQVEVVRVCVHRFTS